MNQALKAGVNFQVYNIQESRLLNILKSFKIEASLISCKNSKFFDHYYIKLAPGVRFSKLDRLLEDIGLALGAQSVPTGTVIMSRGLYKLSVQTKEIISPTFSQMLSKYDKSLYAPIFIGASESGNLIYKDLNKIPNLIVGGTTGSGKSILLHSFVMSLLKSDAKLYLCDPKMVEFERYGEYNAVKSISSSVKESSAVICDLTKVMNNRFSLLRKKGFRSASEMHKKNPGSMPPICLIIDEWADLVLQDKGLQTKLSILAQKGRAAGISIILATQRPAASVISGLIKANFPGRIALRVASALDSRVILDKSGAEKIDKVGMGLMIDSTSSSPILFRAPNIRDIDSDLRALGLKRFKASKLLGIFGF